MKKSKFTEQQIGFALKQAETGAPVAEVCGKTSVSEATYFDWKRKFSGLGTAELKRKARIMRLSSRSTAAFETSV